MFVSSHVLGEVEQIADEVLMLARGRMVRSGSLADLRAEAGVVTAVRSPEIERLRSLLEASGYDVRSAAEDELIVDGRPEFVTVPTGDGTDALSLHDSDLLARVVGVGTAAGQIVMLVLGILSFTQEFRFGTATSTFLVAPARRRVLAGKALALAVAGLVFAAATMTLNIVLSAIVIDARGGAIVWSGELVAVLAAAVAVMALYGMIGVAWGAIIRNQIVAVAAALVWLLALEGLLITLLPAIGRWLPGGATVGLLQEGRAATTHGPLLPAWEAGLVLLGYAALLGLLASAVTLRRDLT